MTKKQVKGEFKSFVKGLITEASELNFPENASLDEKNFELFKTGERKRRIGLSVEKYFTTTMSEAFADIFLERGNINVLEWRTVGNILNFDFYVLILPGIVQLIRADNYTEYDVFDIDVTDAKVINGSLVCTTSSKEISVIFWNGSGFVSENKRIKVRDIWGIDTGFPEGLFNYRPEYSAMNNNIRYNLYNQSWGYPQTNKDGIREDPTESYSLGWAVPPGPYPSDSENVWSGMYFDPAVTPPQERWRISKSVEKYGPNVPVGKGYFIIDLLERSASRKQAIITNKSQFPEMEMGDFNPPIDKADGGPTCITEFAGRVFYSGFSDVGFIGDSRSPRLYNAVCFSQLLSGFSNIASCYQLGDPTNREESDVVDTDGGILFISEAENIVGLSVFKNALLVFANNGVWAVTGGGDYGFTATNYKRIKISSSGCLDRYSIVSTNAGVFFWGSEGIFQITTDRVGDIVAVNLTQETIQTYYNSVIADLGFNRVRGCFDRINKKLRWAVKGESLITSNIVPQELTFDTSLQSFSVNEFAVPNKTWPTIFGVFSSDTYTKTFRNDLYGYKYYGFKLVDGFFVFFIASSGNSFYDWKEVDDVGVDNKAFLLTGHTTGNDSSVAKQIPYFTLHMRRTETGVDSLGNIIRPSGCLARTQWGFSVSESSGKWSPLMPVYRFKNEFLEPDFSIITTKNKMRGRGNAFSLYMETEPGKDCQIIGWNVALNGNQF
jgi:hypothetical protein